MSGDDWLRAKRALDAVLAREPEEREAFLEQLLADDPAVLEEVRSLLEAYQESFLEEAAAPVSVSALSEEPPVPETLGPYTVVGRLGAGGMAEVYRVVDSDGRSFALKRLAEAKELVSTEELSRLRREASAVAALDHPNIVRFISVFDHEGSPHIVMEYLEGRTLSDVLSADRRLDPSEAVTIATQVANALACAHEIGIVHRDLKPANVFITDQDVVKLLDFGIAKLLEEIDRGFFGDDAQITKSGEILGTAGYMAPEQARGKSVDARADVFGFGCLLYRMLSGREAFEGESALDRRLAILKAEPPRLLELRPEVGKELDALVHGALEKDPDARPGSMHVILAVLRAQARA